MYPGAATGNWIFHEKEQNKKIKIKNFPKSQVAISEKKKKPSGSKAEYIMRNAGLEEAQAGFKIAKRNINNLTDADDTILMACYLGWS